MVSCWEAVGMHLNFKFYRWPSSGVRECEFRGSTKTFVLSIKGRPEGIELRSTASFLLLSAAAVFCIYRYWHEVRESQWIQADH